MTKLFLIITLLSLGFTGICQDIIYFIDGSKVNAKILEIHENEIKYKKSDNLEGPSYFLSIEKVNKIVYSSGKAEIFHENNTGAKNSVQKENTFKQDGYPRINYDPKAKRKYRYTINNQVVRRREIGKYVMVNKEAFIFYEKAEKFHGLQVISGVMGCIGFFGIGVIGGVATMNSNKTLSLALMITGATITTIFWVVDDHAVKNEKKYMRKAIDIYNDGIPYAHLKNKRNMSLNFGTTNNGIGLCLIF